MKILKSLLNKICLTLAIGLFFIGCSDLSLEKNWTVLNGTGKLVISTNFSDTKTRTVLPTPFSTEVLGYKWVLYAQSSSSTEQIEVKAWEDTKDENNISILAYNNMLNDDYILVDVGSYTFTLIVYNGDNKKVLEGSEEFTINPSQNNKLEFNMKEATGSDVADGSIVFKLKWNELGVVDKVQANLLKSDGSNLDDGSFKNVDLTVFSAEDKSYEYVEFKTADNSNLPSGYYILKLELQQNVGDESAADYKIINTYTCLFYVAPGLCSEGEFLLENLAKLYTISYELNSGKFDTNTTIVTSYNKYTSFELPTPTRFGYAFTGWYTDEQLSPSSKVENPSNYKISSDVTLYASWIELGSVLEYPINDWYILKAYVESKNGYDSVDAYITGTLNADETLPLRCPVNIIAVNSATLLRQSSFSDSMIENAFSLTLDGVTLDGNNIENASSLINSSADITLKNCILKNNKNSESGGAIYVGIGNVIATNVTIENCSAKYGGAVYINTDCSFEMSSSTIQNNTAAKGAGVYVASNGIFNMNNGTISDNAATSNSEASLGGGVYVDANGTFNMKDGSIINNSVNYTGTTLMGGGAGVAVDFQTTSSGLFNMTGGKIQGNTTIGNKDYGSGVFVNGSTQGYLGIFKISGNAVVVSDNDVYLNYVAKITVTGALTGTTPVATITPSSYTDKKQVIQVEGVAFESVISKFSVTPKLNENGQYENWIINEIGQIVSN
ncbi:MAG: InlB B-repeat-containing protein [Treponema sp.]|nr:InlB B-repeat-containing protein [Treponema sp.]